MSYASKQEINEELYDRLYAGYEQVLMLLVSFILEECSQERAEYLLSVVIPFHVDDPSVLNDITNILEHNNAKKKEILDKLIAEKEKLLAAYLEEAECSNVSH